MTEEIDYAKALLDPAAAFESPAHVVSQDGLTTAQKVEILRRWEYDATEIAVAEEEGMLGEAPLLVRRILLALDELGANVDVEHTAPTKQKGLD